ncbi:MAG: hypothetical protein JRG73_02750 [Deltaproteobacteria bacterium]|nr:hypothetical protein [Deltaproteobacteria bacterium]
MILIGRHNRLKPFVETLSNAIYIDRANRGAIPEPECFSLSRLPLNPSLVKGRIGNEFPGVSPKFQGKKEVDAALEDHLPVLISRGGDPRNVS